MNLGEMNSNRYGFHIGHFDRNEISYRHQICMLTEFNGNEIDTGFNAYIHSKQNCLVLSNQYKIF